MKKNKSMAIFDDRDFPISVVRKSLFQGTGADIEELKEKPMIGIANSFTEINPGHAHLDRVARAVKDGVNAAGGVPFEFNVPAPCDGITEGHEGMRFVLAQRDLIADIVETHVRSMRYDGVVFIASCDKILPGMLMAAARLDLPSIFITGGPNTMNMRFKSSMKGSIDHKSYTDPMDKLASATCASCGACEVMGTANTFQCLTEALGMSLPGSANVPAFHADRLVYARRTGRRILDLVEGETTARHILTKHALENAVMVDLAIGGSTNSTLHLPALAHELGIDLPLDVFNDYNKKIPTICSIAPNGPHGIIDLYRAGGIPGVMKVLIDDLHQDVTNVSGFSLKDITDYSEVTDANVIRDRKNPYLPEGGTVVLKGNLAPEGAVVKQSAVSAKMMKFTGRARVFESEADCLKAVREKKLVDGEVIIIRNEGPRGGPGMPETLAVTMALELHGYGETALITDGRFSGATAGPCIGHVSPEARSGGPIAALRDGDQIIIDIPGRRLDVKLPESEIRARVAAFAPPAKEIPAGYMRRYVKHVSSAARGAVME
ncbi:MAG: dihydroxy-acid dehydratase [Spirochaetes bacterium]|nr:dihydroxy-acid dehydratase [Spirochaetota bacterium]